MNDDGDSLPLGLHTDLYEIRMAETYFRRGMSAPATFSLFSRPSRKRPWLVAAGIDRALDVLESFTFGPDELDYLASQNVPDDVLDHLRELRFEGEVWAVPDGTIVLGDEPILEVTASLPVAQLVETAVMNAIQLDTMVATKAARCVLAADGRTVVDFGFRRAHGLEAGIRAARASYLGGVAATSNVEAGRRYGLPISGTMAHSFVQAFDSERAAYRAFAEDHPDSTVLLVDTYEIHQGIDNAIRVMRDLADEGVFVGAIRIDSDPLDEFATWARRRLDEAGLGDVQIVLSGALDEYAVAELVAAGTPADGFGIGSSLVTSSDRPTLDMAYKLVAYDGRGRAKYSAGKRSLPGAKQIFRTVGPDTDVLARRESTAPGEALLRPVWQGSDRRYALDLEAARDRAREQLELLPASWRVPAYDDEPPHPRIAADLDAYAAEVEDRELGGTRQG